MRLSVQLRVPTAGEGKRWQRSVYLDPDARDIVVRFADMNAVGATPIGSLQLADVRTVLFVIDTINTHPGTTGRFVLDHVRLILPGTPVR
jgi:hypothetical protein